jgi:hypothetical protein
MAGTSDHRVRGTLKPRLEGEPDGLSAARGIVDAALNRLAFAFGLAIMPRELTREAIEYDDATKSLVRRIPVDPGGIRIRGSAKVAFSPSPDNIASALRSVPDQCGAALTLYRAANANTDQVVWFLILYQVL